MDESEEALREVRRAVKELQAERSLRTFGWELGVSKDLIHRFLRGQRDIVDPLYLALYCRFPELRCLLEGYQRQRAFNGKEAGTASPSRRA